MTTIPLSKGCRFLSGGTPAKGVAEYWAGSLPWFSPKDIKQFELTDSIDHISEAAVIASATQKVSSGTILLVGRSGVLAHTLPVGIVRRDATFNQDIKAIVPDERFDPDFVALFLKAQEHYVIQQGVKVGATVHSLKSGFVESLEIPLIKLDQQRRIAADLKAQLAAVEEARKAAQAQLEEIEHLPARLLAQAFGNV